MNFFLDMIHHIFHKHEILQWKKKLRINFDLGIMSLASFFNLAASYNVLKACDVSR